METFRMQSLLWRGTVSQRPISKYHWVVPILALAAIFAFFSGRSYAQDTTAGTGISGTVSDNSGGVVPSAQVTVKGSAGESRQATTDAQGVFTVLGLTPGSYQISISLAGFTEQHVSATVSAGGVARFDVTLVPAAAASDVTVEERVGGVETENAAVSGDFSAKAVVSQPLNGRNFTQLIAQTPGVSNQTSQDEAKVGVLGSVKYSVNGGRVEYNTFDVDGSDVLNSGINGSSSTLVVYPSLDAIQEVRVLTSNYGAMYGRTASGTVLVTTKGGTEQFHGNGYYFGRNEFFNARNFFDETQGAPLYRRHDFGGTIGGPVIIPGHEKAEKKTFFFFSEEYRWEKSPQQYNQAVPSVAERSGNFNDVCPAVGSPSYPLFSRASYPDCPAYIRPSPNTYPKDFAFAGNQLAGEQGTLDRNAVAILNTGLIPAPNSTSGCNSSIGSCYDTTVSPLTTWREELFRIDHNFNSTTRASFRFIHDSWDTTVPTPQWGIIQNSFPTVENAFTGPGISLVARLTKTISPTLINEFIFSYVNSTITLTDIPGPGATIQRPAALDEPCSTEGANTIQCPAGYLFNNGFGGKIPGIVIGGTNQEYGGNGFAVDSSYMPWHHTNPVYTFGDSISKIIGNHNIQLGGQLILYHRAQTNGPIGAATGDLQGILTFSNQGSEYSTGNAFADFLRHDGGGVGGAVQSYTQDSAQLNYSQRYQIAEPYIQDDWRVTPHLTVNLGLRISLFGTYRETNGQAYNWEQSAYNPALASQAYVSPQFGSLFDNSDGLKDSTVQVPLDLSNLDPRITNGLVHCGVNGVPASCMKGHLFNPAPRVGFAWDPNGDGRSSIRGGYGLFFEHGTGNESNTGSLEGSSPLVLNMTQTFITGWGCIGGANSAACDTAPTPAFPLNVTSIPTKAVWPYVQQWSLSYQRQINSRMVATFAYVGSKGTHLTDERNLNQLPPVPASQNPFPAHVPLIPYLPAPNHQQGGDCGNYDTVTGSGLPFAPGFALNSGAVVYPGDPGFINLEAACYNNVPETPTPYDPNSLRQFAPGFGQIYALENSADSSYQAFQSTLQRTAGPLTLGVSYTLSRSMDDSSDRTEANFINAYDLRSNWARSDFDQKNLLNVSYVYALPLTKLVKNPSNLWRQILGSWELSGLTVYQSGTPFSVINNGGTDGISVQDNAGVANGTGATSYPDLVSNPYYAPPAAGNNGRSFGPLLLNPGAFAAPRGLTFGDAGRNVLTNPRRTNFDTALLKHIKIDETKSVELRFEAFNVFNHTEFRIYDSNLGNAANNTVSCYGGAATGYSAAGGDGTDCLTGSAFLHPINAHRPRTIQYGVKFAF